MTNFKPFRISSPCALAILSLLAGCALMGGGSDPVTLFQFGRAGQAEPAPQPPALQQPVVIIYPGASFGRESRDDRILTSTGNRSAYIAEARWIAPARELFDTIAVRDIERLSPSIRVVRVGAPTKADFMLAIDVRRFEADYSAGPETAPEVVVDARAKLMRVADKVIVGDWPIVKRETAMDNRVGEIVSAFDRAASNVSTQIANSVGAALATG